MGHGGTAPEPVPAARGGNAEEEDLRPVSVLEVERKFRVHGLFRLPDLVLEDGTHLAPSTTATLSAAYFDTDDLRLARSKVSLRRREGGSDEGWHLKLPVRAETREELTLSLEGRPADVPPAELSELVLALTRTAPLEGVALLLTERTTYPVTAKDGRQLASLTDDSVSVLDGDHVVSRFRELEVELVDGGADVLDQVGEALAEAGAVPGGTVSKVARALGPLAAAEPDIPAPGAVRPGDPAKQAIRAHLARNSRMLITHDVGVRRDLPDSVHQMRVAARRLRSGLKVFEPLLDPAVTTPLRAELAWLASVLGEVRDREVLRGRLLRDLGRLKDDPHLDVDVTGAQRLVRSSLTGEMAGARSKVLAALRSQRYLALLDALVAACSEPPTLETADAPCAEALPPLVRRSWRRLARDVEGLTEDGPDAEWHETRIAAKRARYACEAVEPVFGKPARRLAEHVELVTELLGEHQDAALAADTVQSLAARKQLAGSTGFVLGLLHARQREAVEETRVELARIWPEVSRGQWRRWLDTGDAR